jgi:hypothetical protein
MQPSEEVPSVTTPVTTPISGGPPTPSLSLSSGNGAGKVRLLTRQALDGRTVASRRFEQLVTSIQNDLGGHDQLSTVTLTLIEAYAGAATALEHLNTQLLQGNEVDFNRLTAAASTLTRIATRLGVERRPKNVTPTLADYLREVDTS